MNTPNIRPSPNCQPVKVVYLKRKRNDLDYPNDDYPVQELRRNEVPIIILHDYLPNESHQINMNLKYSNGENWRKARNTLYRDHIRYTGASYGNDTLFEIKRLSAVRLYGHFHVKINQFAGNFTWEKIENFLTALLGLNRAAGNFQRPIDAYKNVRINSRSYKVPVELKKDEYLGGHPPKYIRTSWRQIRHLTQGGLYDQVKNNLTTSGVFVIGVIEDKLLIPDENPGEVLISVWVIDAKEANLTPVPRWGRNEQINERSRDEINNFSLDTIPVNFIKELKQNGFVNRGEPKIFGSFRT